MAQSSDYTIPLIGEEAPKFTAQSTNGTIHFPKDFGNTWKVILSHPRDFTPVCTSELLSLTKMQDDFNAINTSIIVLSADKIDLHMDWKRVLEEIAQRENPDAKIDFPLVEDYTLTVSRKYGMLHDPVSTSRDVR